MRPENPMLRQLNVLVEDMLAIRYRGGEYSRLARAQGLVDGYMRALISGGIATQQEILALVREQRTVLDGASIRALHIDDVEATAAA